VGWSITTDRDYIREIFEPASSSIEARLKAAQVFHDAGIETYAFIGPILPMDPEALAKKLIGRVEYVLIDKMNYPYKVSGLYKKHKLEKYLSDEFFEFARDKLKAILSRAGIEVNEIF
jgi:DNA repair photolyase